MVHHGHENWCFWEDINSTGGFSESGPHLNVAGRHPMTSKNNPCNHRCNFGFRRSDHANPVRTFHDEHHRVRDEGLATALTETR